MKSKDFVFTERDGELFFVGDFDGYYNNCDDPWEQSGVGEMASYYARSRSRMLQQLRNIGLNKILDVGCGLGYTTRLIANENMDYVVKGCDVSAVAVDKARRNFPELCFEQRDITDSAAIQKSQERFDVVILNQLLWYVLDDLDSVFSNAQCLLNSGGKLLIINAFARTQRYGTQVIDGFSGAVKRFSSIEGFHLDSAHYHDEGDEHADGCFIFHLEERSPAN